MYNGISVMVLEGFTHSGNLLQAGVYALVWREEVVYVGKASNLLRRIYQHQNNRERWANKSPGWAKVKAIPFDDFWVRLVLRGRLDVVEREMIARYRPRYNDQLVPKVPLPPMMINGVQIGGLPQPPQQFERRV